MNGGELIWLRKICSSGDHLGEIVRSWSKLLD